MSFEVAATAIPVVESGKMRALAVTCPRRLAQLPDAPTFAEAWNQRAIGHYSLGQFVDSIRDCRQAVEINPYHFGAVAGMGQCYLRLGNQLWALESFRRALALNPNLEGIRGNVTSLERKLKNES